MLTNIYELPPVPFLAELVTDLHRDAGIRIERIVSTGQTTDWLNQNETEFVILIQGNATLEFDDGREVTMKPGDTILIKPHQRHRVTFTSTEPPCIWLCVFW